MTQYRLWRAVEISAMVVMRFHWIGAEPLSGPFSAHTKSIQCVWYPALLNPCHHNVEDLGRIDTSTAEAMSETG
jgi:hypothetical protein